MEKTRTTQKIVEHTEHDFYCDECEKFLGTSKEYRDGYYSELGSYECSFYIRNWYRLKTILCEECADKKTKQIQEQLLNLGFKETH